MGNALGADEPRTNELVPPSSTERVLRSVWCAVYGEHAARDEYPGGHWLISSELWRLTWLESAGRSCTQLGMPQEKLQSRDILILFIIQFRCY